jgi:hypothetical protein
MSKFVVSFVFAGSGVNGGEFGPNDADGELPKDLDAISLVLHAVSNIDDSDHVEAKN